MTIVTTTIGSDGIIVSGSSTNSVTYNTAAVGSVDNTIPNKLRVTEYISSNKKVVKVRLEYFDTTVGAWLEIPRFKKYITALDKNDQ